MINDIVSGISRKLNDTFGDDIEIYKEQVKQGLKEPCFIISCINLVSIPIVGERYLRQALFSVNYFPKSGTDAKVECLDVQDTLCIALEYIDAGDGLLRGTGMSGQIVDGVLVFTVNYDMYVRKDIEREPMETIKITHKMEG